MDDIFNNQKYKIISKLGQGSFGSAFKVLNKEDNMIYVIKQISLNEAKKEEIESIKKEAAILSKIKNEHIVKYFDSFTEQNTFNIVMEYCDGLDLRKYINEHRESGKPIDEPLIYYFIIDICLGLKEIHSQNLIHRDLKPDNLFITSDEKIKIGDFGIAKQLNNANEYAKTQVGTMLYMAPEIINGEKYNNKVDMWSLGCIIHELCTLNYCFSGLSINELIKKITNVKHEKINSSLYGSFMQKLIDSLLDQDPHKRPKTDEILNSVRMHIVEMVIDKMTQLLEKDEVYQNYLIERNIQNSIDQVDINVLNRERKYVKIKYWLSNSFIGLPLYFLSAGLITGGIGFAIGLGLMFLNGIATLFILDPNKKVLFIRENSIIVKKIELKLIEKIRDKLDKELLKQKIVIFNKENFNKQIEKVKQKLISPRYLKKLQRIITKNFNILLVGCTNAGKSTLINEFLKLDEKTRAKESDGGPTDTIDFASYCGTRNNKTFTLHDTNGITNSGKDSIENKIKNTINEIEQRIGSHDPNKLIHCIWYCAQGSNIQESDADFIEKLLNIYSTYSIPIIFVHTQTYSKKQSNTCKKGIQKYLLKIYNEDKEKVEKILENNYIEILAREDEEEGKPSFGLDTLEARSIKEIELKGFKSAYFELIKKDINPILINGVFNIVFTEANLKKLEENAMKNLDKYLETIKIILNDNKLDLTEDIKNKNITSINCIYSSFQKLQTDMKDELKTFLQMSNLKKDNEKFIKEIYDDKSEEYKKKNSFEDFSKKVEKLIYDNISSNSKEVINNILNQGFSFFMIETLKGGIKEQFKSIEKAILGEIYKELFKDIE